MRLKIIVTAEDIQNGARWSEWASPIALAFQREFPGQSIKVGAAVAYVGLQRVFLPVDVQFFLRDFNCGCPVEPLSFEIELPRGAK